MPFKYQPQWQGPLSGRSFEKQTEDFLNGIESRVDEIDTRQTPSDAIPMAPGVGSAGTSGEYSRGDHSHPLQASVAGNAGTADALSEAREISFSGEGSGSNWFSGASDVSLPLTVACVADGSTERRQISSRFADFVNVKDFGAVGDGVTDDTAAIQAAVDFAKTASNPGGAVGRTVWFPYGKYLVTSPVFAWRMRPKSSEPSLTRVDLVFAGESQWSSQIVAGFSGDASQSVINCSRPAGIDPDRRCCPTSFRDLGFAMAAPNAIACPAYINVYGWGESRMDHVRMGQSDNTHVRGADLQNMRAVDVVSFYGGKAWKYKESLQEAITLTATTITTQSSVFDAADVGRRVFLTSSENSKTSGFFTIANVVSSTEVEISETGYNMQAGRLTWEPARCSMTAGSAALTANASCFAATDVGRVVWVRGARDGLYGDAFLRASIAEFVDGSNVILDTAADITVADAEFAQPVLDFYSPSALSSGSSDVALNNLQVEHYRGLAVGIENATGWRIDGKIHGETAYYNNPSSAAMWLDDYDGVNSLIFDSSCALTGTRAVISNNNASVVFNSLATRHNRNEHILHQDELKVTQTEDWGTFGGGGSTVVNGCTVLSRSSDLSVLFEDDNAAIPRLFVNGTITFSGSPKPISYLAKTAYFDMENGLIVDGKISGSLLTSTGGVISYGEILASKSTLACSSPSGSYKAALSVTNNATAVLTVGSSQRLQSTGAGFQSGLTTNTYNLGSATSLWKEVFAGSGTINTSDARRKTAIGDPDDALMRAWGRVRFRIFQMADAVQAKGAAARIHAGVVAQEVAEAFAAEGLDASRYGLFCYDSWEDVYDDVPVVDEPAVYDDDGMILVPEKTHMERRLVTPAGDAYGVRYAEALALECAYQRWKLEQIEARIAALESRPA